MAPPPPPLPSGRDTQLQGFCGHSLSNEVGRERGQSLHGVTASGQAVLGCGDRRLLPGRGSSPGGAELGRHARLWGRQARPCAHVTSPGNGVTVGLIGVSLFLVLASAKTAASR